MYSRKEFEEIAVRRGYATRANAAKYTKAYPKESYSEEDLIDCYRYDAREPEEKSMFTGRNKGASYSAEEAMQAKRDSWL